MPLYPRVARHLSTLWELAEEERERREVEVLERMAMDVDAVGVRELKLDKLYTFIRSVHAFKDTWGIRPGTEEAYKGIAEAVKAYIEEEGL